MKMEVIQSSNVDLDLNSNINVFKEGGYWSSYTMPAGGKSGGRKRHPATVQTPPRNRPHHQNHIDLDAGASPSSYDIMNASPEFSATVRSVALNLEESLREAKKVHLACGEVLLPPDLLTRVARDIIRMAETEPCGLRGALILLNFDPTGNAIITSNNKENHNSSNSTGTNNNGNRRDLHSSNSSLNSTSSNGSSSSAYSSASSSVSSHNGCAGGAALAPSAPLGTNNKDVKNIGRVRWDSNTVTTFELHLTLREDPAPWYSRLPQILRNLTKGGTVVVSPAYTIAKKKLYRSH